MSQNPNKNILELPEEILSQILSNLSLRDLKNVSITCTDLNKLSENHIKVKSKLCFGEPQTAFQIRKISEFQRNYQNIHIDELQHANVILGQLEKLNFKNILLELDINEDDRIYLTSSLKNIVDKYENILLEISLNFQYEIDDILHQEILEAGIEFSIKSIVYEKKSPNVFGKCLSSFTNLESLALDCSEELPKIVKPRYLKGLSCTGVCSLESVKSIAKGLESLKIASQLSQAEIIEKILENNKSSLKKLNLCIANFELNEPTRILNLVHPLESLEEMSLRSALITKGLAEWLEKGLYLKKLVLHCCDFDKEVSSSFLTNIQDLSWLALNEDSQEQFYNSLTYLSSLENLTFYSFGKIDMKLEEISELDNLRYLFVDNEGFGSLVHNMKAPNLRHFVFHCKENSVNLGEVSKNLEKLSEESFLLEKFQFVSDKFEYKKEELLDLFDNIFEKFKFLKEFSMKMEFDENFNEICEKIQNIDGLETAVIRTWTESMEDMEVLGQKFTDKIRIEFNFYENKVEFYFPK